MKITAEYLHEKWNAFNYYDGGYIQIEVKHALEWHVGYKEIDQKALVIISQNEPELLPSSKSEGSRKRSEERPKSAFRNGGTG